MRLLGLGRGTTVRFDPISFSELLKDWLTVDLQLANFYLSLIFLAGSAIFFCVVPCLICALLCSLGSYLGMEDKPDFWVRWNDEREQARAQGSKSGSVREAAHDQLECEESKHSAQAQEVVNPAVTVNTLARGDVAFVA